MVLHESNEKEIRELLLYRKVVKVTGNTLTLDNGTELIIKGNQGCPSCNAGWYSITELNDCNNVITNVEFACDTTDEYEDEDEHRTYKIFVYAEDKRIKLVQIDGYEGGGYYGTGYEIYVSIKE